MMMTQAAREYCRVREARPIRPASAEDAHRMPERPWTAAQIAGPAADYAPGMHAAEMCRVINALRRQTSASMAAWEAECAAVAARRVEYTETILPGLLAEYEARRAAHLAVEATAEADLPAELRGNERVDTYTRCSRYLAGRARARRLADAGV